MDPFRVFKMYQGSIRFPQNFSDPYKSFQILSNFSKLFQVLSDPCRLSQIFPVFFRFFQIFTSSFRFLQIHYESPNFSQIISDPFVFSQSLSNSFRFFSILSDLQEFFTFQIVADPSRSFQIFPYSFRFLQTGLEILSDFLKFLQILSNCFILFATLFFESKSSRFFKMFRFCQIVSNLYKSFHMPGDTSKFLRIFLDSFKYCQILRDSLRFLQNSLKFSQILLDSLTLL